MSECEHANGKSIGFTDKNKRAWEKYIITPSQAKGKNVRVWDLYVCNNCGRVIDSDNGEALNELDLAAWVNDLLYMQRVRILEFVESLE